MQAMVNSMEGRCQYNSDIGYENNTTEQGMNEENIFPWTVWISITGPMPLNIIEAL
jgi:hypothetical protein